MIYFFKTLGFIIIMIHAVVGAWCAFNHLICALASICWFKKTGYPIDKGNFQHHISLSAVYVGGLVFDGFIASFFIFM